MINKYEVTYDFGSTLTLEIDSEKFGEGDAKEVNEFWSGSEARKVYAGSHLKAFIKMLSIKIFELSMSTFSVADAFDWENGRGIEGFPSVSGVSGVKLVRYDDFELEESDVSIEEVK